MEIRNHFIQIVLTVFLIAALGGCEKPPPQVTLKITSSPSLPDAQVGEPYSVRLRATSVGLPLTWTGTPPAGLKLYSKSGVISGAPETAGTFSFEITVTNSATPKASDTKQFTLLVQPADVPGKLSIITSSPLPDGEKGLRYEKSLKASGGQGALKWSGKPPANLLLNQNTGVISGTPNAVGGFNFDIKVADQATPEQTDTKNFSLKILQVPAEPLVITTTSPLPEGTQGTAYQVTLQARDGTRPLRWSVASGALPAGLNLAAATGRISGTPSAAGNFNVGIGVTDSASPARTANKTFQLRIRAVIPPPPVISSNSPLPEGTQGTAYQVTLQARDGTRPLRWSVASGALPAGLNLAAATGRISGTPSAAGNFNVGIRVADSASPARSVNKTFQLRIRAVIPPPPVITSNSPLPEGTQGTAYQVTLQARDGSRPLRWSVASGALPASLNLAAATGRISGTPSAAGNFNFGIRVTDNASPARTVNKTFQLRIRAAIPPPPVITSNSPLPEGTQGTAYQVTLQARDGSRPLRWSVASGALPAGLNLAAATGRISGTPSAAGNFNVGIRVTDSASPSRSANKSFRIVISEVCAITPSALPNGTENQSYSGATLLTKGCTGPLNWTVSSGSMPTGLSLNAQTGVISGTPTRADTFNFTVRVTDSSNPAQSDTESFRITIEPEPVVGRVIDISGINMRDNWVATVDGASVNPVGRRVTIRVRRGDGITWQVRNAGNFTHGIVFESESQMRVFLDIEKSQPLALRPGIFDPPDNGFGTQGFPNNTELMRATVKNVSGQNQRLNFTCFVHGTGRMDGTLIFE